MRRPLRGQTMVELALVAPLFFMLVFGIIILGIGVFYQQQLTNAAREAARYAAVHSATAIDPTTSNRPVNPAIAVASNNDVSSDSPSNHWPSMTDVARNAVFAIPREAVKVSACWSGYWQTDGSGGFLPNTWDAGPVDGLGRDNKYLSCTLGLPNPTTGLVQNVDPQSGSLDGDAAQPGVQAVDADPSKAGFQGISLGCVESGDLPTTSADNDSASNLAWSQSATANAVTVYACYVWHPPLAGFLLIPEDVTLRAVITEKVQHQQ